MTIQQIYNLAITMGQKADPRGAGKFLYPDSQILCGNPQKKVNKVFAGIDMEVADLLLVKELNKQGAGIDLVISHHPQGKALMQLPEILDMHIGIASRIGVSKKKAANLIQKHKAEKYIAYQDFNFNAAVQVAELLGIAFVSLHTPLDNLTNAYIQKYILKKNYKNLGELVAGIQKIPEFLKATLLGCPPLIAVGMPENKLGKILVSLSGGTDPSLEFYLALAEAGMNTLVEMHTPVEVIAALAKKKVYVINLGHMASDSIGINIYLQKLEEKGIEVITAGGIIKKKGALT